MKIAVNTRFLLKNKLEGIGWYTYEILKRMVKDHPDDEFIFFFDRPFDPAFRFGENVQPVILFPSARHPFLWWFWFEISVANALKKYQPDVFFSPDGFLTLKTSIPTVMVTHDVAYLHYPDQIPSLVKRYYNSFVPKFLQKASKVITVSHFSKSDIVQHYAIAEDHIRVIYNGSRAHFKPLKAEAIRKVRDRYSNGQPYFLYIGSIHPRKNVDRLLVAFEQFKKDTNSEVKLLIAGRMAWQSSPIGQLYNKMAYKEEVVFLGYVEDRKLADILGAALALTYVSLFEGFGLPVVEAMNCKVPVITSADTVLSEIAGDAACLVDPMNVTEIAAAMKSVAVDEELRKNLIQRGWKRRTQFDWDIAAKEVYYYLSKYKQSI